MDTSKYDESERFKQGLQVRREVLGDEYVKPAIERGDKDEFQRALQQFATEDCWGSVWCRPGLDRKTRSIINLTMLSTVGRVHEPKLHIRGAVNNGVDRTRVVSGKSVTVRVDLGCCRLINKKNQSTKQEKQYKQQT